MNETLNATLKAKTTISCDCCGASLLRVKSFKVSTLTKEAAKIEMSAKIAIWKKSLEKQNCKFCQSIIDSL